MIEVLEPIAIKRLETIIQTFVNEFGMNEQDAALLSLIKKSKRIILEL